MSTAKWFYFCLIFANQTHTAYLCGINATFVGINLILGVYFLFCSLQSKPKTSTPSKNIKKVAYYANKEIEASRSI